MFSEVQETLTDGDYSMLSFALIYLKLI